MATRVPCPSCGADNEVGARRCRICTIVLDSAAPEGGASPDGGGFDPFVPLPPPPPGSTGAHPPHDDPLSVPGAQAFEPFDPSAPVDEPLSADEIDRLARESVRNERMARRPRLLRRVFDED